MAEKNKPVRSRKPAPPQGLRARLNLSVEQIIVGGTIGATILVLVIIFMSSFINNRNRTQSIEDVEIIPVVSGQHVETAVNYTTIPPAGGPHNPAWQNCGVYDEPIRSEHAVHSLEHGAIWITYDPSALTPDQIDRLAGITRQSDHRLLSPFPGIDSPIVLSAWGYQVRVDSPDDPRVMQFILKYESGPTTPELGGLCSNGVGQTLAQLQGR
jgi:hypothetical protein